MIIENYADRRRTRVQPFIVDILHRLGTRRSCTALATEMEVEGSRLETLLVALEQTGLLRSERTSAAAHARDAACSRWGEWNPAAGYFHSATVDVMFRSAAEGSKHFRKKVRIAPRPAILKEVRGPFCPMRKPMLDGEFPSVLLRRRTWREFDRARVPLDALSTLLYLTAGVQAWAHVEHEGRVPLKTSPSAGSRHPIESYLVALNCGGVDRGIYHYAADRHGLTRVRTASRRDVEKFLPEQDWYRTAAAIVFFTAATDRTRWRYPYARAYRALQIEAGHVCQTFCLAATWLGLAPFCTLALADSKIERALRLVPGNDIVLYAAGVGVKPRGVEWAPWPGRRGLTPERHVIPK